MFVLRICQSNWCPIAQQHVLKGAYLQRDSGRVSTPHTRTGAALVHRLDIVAVAASKLWPMIFSVPVMALAQARISSYTPACSVHDLPGFPEPVQPKPLHGVWGGAAKRHMASYP